MSSGLGLFQSPLLLAACLSTSFRCWGHVALVVEEIPHVLLWRSGLYYVKDALITSQFTSID